MFSCTCGCITSNSNIKQVRFILQKQLFIANFTNYNIYHLLVAAKTFNFFYDIEIFAV